MAARPTTAQEALEQWQSSGGGAKGQYWDPLDLEMRGLEGTTTPEGALRLIQKRYDAASGMATPKAPDATPAPAPAAPAPPSMAALASAGAGSGNPSPGGPTAEATIPSSLKSLASMASVGGGSSTSQQPIAAPESLRPGLGQRLYPQYNASLASLQRAIY